MATKSKPRSKTSKFPKLEEMDVATLDAIKSVVDVIMAVNPGAADSFAKSFAFQRDGKLRLNQIKAAAFFDLLQQFVTDPKRQKTHRELRRLVSESPKGRA